MDRVRLGRTGLDVSVAGLGCGGSSRLGKRYGASVEDSVRIVHEALDLGVNFIDTAPTYETEPIVGTALKDRRTDAVISTKCDPIRSDGSRLDAKALRLSLESSLRSLRTDTIDVFHLHRVRISDYEYCVTELVPELERLRAEGSIRYLAVSERFEEEFDHAMLQTATQTGCWDVMMVGFNILNPSARQWVFPETIANDIGIEAMFAVRRTLSDTATLKRVVNNAIATGLIDGEQVDPNDPLGFLVHEGGATSLTDAGYRFVRHEPGCHVVLTGTGNVEHLRANVQSLNRGPLPEDDRRRLAELFGHLAHFSGS